MGATYVDHLMGLGSETQNYSRLSQLMPIRSAFSNKLRFTASPVPDQRDQKTWLSGFAAGNTCLSWTASDMRLDVLNQDLHFIRAHLLVEVHVFVHGGHHIIGMYEAALGPLNVLNG